MTIGHMVDDRGNKDVFLIVDGKEYLCGEWIAKIDQKDPVIDALVIKFTMPGVVSENNAPGGKTNTISLDMDTAFAKKYKGQKVQKYSYKTGLTYGTLESSNFAITETATSHGEPDNKLTGALLVTSDNDKFLEFGECGALLTTTPDDSGKVVALGVLFARVSGKFEGRERCKYLAYSLAELFKVLRDSELANISEKMSSGMSSRGPFYGAALNPFAERRSTSEASELAETVCDDTDSGLYTGIVSVR